MSSNANVIEVEGEIDEEESVDVNPASKVPEVEEKEKKVVDLQISSPDEYKNLQDIVKILNDERRIDLDNQLKKAELIL